MLKHQDGFTVVELLISIGIVGVLLTGISSFFVDSSKNYLAQNGIIQMQSDARAAMDFMVRELRHVYGTPTISTTVTNNDTISFDRIEDTGYASDGALTTLNDTTKAWQANAFALSTDTSYTVRIMRGTGAGQIKTISTNTATQLTITPAWAITPDTRSVYVITRNKGFTLSSASDHVLRYRSSATDQNNPLSDNITALSFQPDPTDPQTMTISLRASTQNIDPRTKNYRSFTLTEAVRQRN
jgi:prepilin-type N-terminal cleavage/methylation domain-containing protein